MTCCGAQGTSVCGAASYYYYESHSYSYYSPYSYSYSYSYGCYYGCATCDGPGDGDCDSCNDGSSPIDDDQDGYGRCPAAAPTVAPPSGARSRKPTRPRNPCPTPRW